MSIQPPVRDGFDANVLVRTAVEALDEFGGGSLTYGEARALLPKWRKAAELTEFERRAVLSRFQKQCPDIEPRNSGPGW